MDVCPSLLHRLGHLLAYLPSQRLALLVRGGHVVHGSGAVLLGLVEGHVLVQQLVLQSAHTVLTQGWFTV